MSIVPDRYPIEFAFPGIQRYAVGTDGIPYVHTFDSGIEGRHVMINCLTHGNEVCGAVVVGELLDRKVRPVTGKLTLSFANPDAYHLFNEKRPDDSRFVDEDLNRVWTVDALEDGRRNSLEIQRAREIRPVIDNVDLLLDIHSMHEKSHPLCLSGPLDKGIELAQSIGSPQTVIVDSGHAEGTRLRDYDGFGNPDSQKNALLIECGQHWEISSLEVARQSVARFLAHSGVIATSDIPPTWVQAQPGVIDIIRVTGAVVAQTMDFRFADPYSGLETIPKQGSVIGWDGGKSVVTPHEDCVLIMPSLRQLRLGVTVVRFGRRQTRC